MQQTVEQHAEAKHLVSRIRFGFYGARKLESLGRPDLARQFRATCRRQIGQLRALRSAVSA